MFNIICHQFIVIIVNFLMCLAVQKCVVDSTTSSNSDATVSYESDSDHEPYFYPDQNSDDDENDQ